MSVMITAQKPRKTEKTPTSKKPAAQEFMNVELNKQAFSHTHAIVFRLAEVIK